MKTRVVLAMILGFACLVCAGLPAALRPTVPAAPLALDLVFLGRQPTTGEILRSAFPPGSEPELKVVNISMQPVGAYAVTIPMASISRTLIERRARLHLGLGNDPEAPPRWEFDAREVLESWDYQGRDTPMPAARSRALSAAGELTWDLTEVTRRQLSSGSRTACVLLVPKSLDYGIDHALKRLEPAARAWLSFEGGESAPPDPRPRAYPDLAIVSLECVGAEIHARYANRGAAGWPGGFDITLGANDRRVMGCANAPLSVPEPGQSAVARFRLESLGLGAFDSMPGPVDLIAELDWEDKIPESDERNNTAVRTVVLPRPAATVPDARAGEGTVVTPPAGTAAGK